MIFRLILTASLLFAFSGNAPVLAAPVSQISSSYTISSGDCDGTLIASGGQFDIAWPASLAGFPDGCLVRVVNQDTDRGKKLVNFPAPVKSILYPGHAVSAQVVSGALVATEVPGRWKIPVSTDICVDTSGSDDNDGLGTAANAATDCKRHIAAAITVAYNDMDAQGRTIRIVPTSGQTFDEGTGNAMTGQITGANALSVAPSSTTAFTWQSTGWCLNVGDNAEAIVYGPIVWRCNTANASSIGALYQHQVSVLDLYGTHTWIPGGSNDNFIFVDGEGRGTLANGVTVSNPFGGTLYANELIRLDNSGRFTVSGTIAPSGNIFMNRLYNLRGTSFMNVSASMPGGYVSLGASQVSGTSTYRSNNVGVPGGIAASNNAVICPSC